MGLLQGKRPLELIPAHNNRAVLFRGMMVRMRRRRALLRIPLHECTRHIRDIYSYMVRLKPREVFPAATVPPL
jgi:hypothetical protein